MNTSTIVSNPPYNPPKLANLIVNNPPYPVGYSAGTVWTEAALKALFIMATIEFQGTYEQWPAGSRGSPKGMPTKVFQNTCMKIQRSIRHLCGNQPRGEAVKQQIEWALTPQAPSPTVDGHKNMICRNRAVAYKVGFITLQSLQRLNKLNGI